MSTDPALEAAREQVVQLLSHHYAYDRLTLEQVEERLEQAHRARSIAALQPLVAGLPATIPRDETTGERALYALAPRADGQAGQRIACIFSEVKRTGAWAPPSALTSVTVFGSTTLDFREARLQPGVTEIEARVTFGELKILVPPGVRLESEGSAVFGVFGHHAPAWDELPPGAPTIRVRGTSIFGEVKVQVRLPGEGAMAALRRRWRGE